MPDLLQVEGLSAGYGEALVLSDISFTLADGQSLALLGRNGTGKTTLINSLLGLTTHRSGSIRLAGRDITRERPERRVHAGMGWSPQERNIFKSLTVEENLTAIARPGAWTVERVFDMFPRLAAAARQPRQPAVGRRAADAGDRPRADRQSASIILLDEPTEGLAPIIVEELLGVLRNVIRNEGMSAIVVEQKARKILGFTDRAIVLDRGRIVLASDSQSLANDPSAARDASGRHRAEAAAVAPAELGSDLHAARLGTPPPGGGRLDCHEFSSPCASDRRTRQAS